MEEYIVEIKRFLKSEKGSALLEASFLYPAILIITVAMLLFTIVVYQQSLVHYQARKVADKVAYVWNYNSDSQEIGKNNGLFEKYTSQDHGDGLYWRLHGNNVLQQFGINFGNGSGVVGTKESLAKTKYKSTNVELDIKFENNLLGRNQIKVTAKSGFKMPSLLKKGFGIDKDVEAVAYADVTDTVESIRDLRFMAYVVGELKNTLEKDGKLASILSKLGF
ncbi:TadE/TadG family type IV pilus assembly protein [Carnobacterium gallinarum]|uniref:TadE/TadG family type IV pilus assembly protein n=1 Tax=Carnobacterium gallinarum TaxID=2749 RepID=UPI0005589841|nr:pilus assembly protein [Carnobacterium gallinarum]